MNPNFNKKIMSKIDRLPIVPESSSIYRVPEKYRKGNEEAYTPHVIPIGPFHRDTKRLRSAEQIKLRYLKSFLSRIKADLFCLGHMVKDCEDRIRDCYEEPITLSSDEFAEMILVDAAFIVELFIRNHFKELREKRDEIFDKQWMSDGVLHDMLLLENQLPFFILLKLYEYVPAWPGSFKTFPELTFEYFQDILRECKLLDGGIQFRHLVDYVRALQIPYFAPKQTRSPAKFEMPLSATELNLSGVRFKCGEGNFSILSIIFKDGVLEMPHLIVHEWSEAYFRNVSAYEQCHHDYKYVSSYLMLMNSLINTKQDVEILIQSGILENKLGNNDLVATLFNNLYKETILGTQFYYWNFCKALNDYSRTPWYYCKAAWYRYKKILIQDYFSNPWSVISVAAAAILLVLTGFQTACSCKDF